MGIGFRREVFVAQARWSGAPAARIVAGMKRYEALVQELGRMIRGGELRPGDRVPSVRTLRRARDVSRSTVLRAYEALELDGLIESRPRSGFYVAPTRTESRAPRPRLQATSVSVSDLIFETLAASRDRGVVPFGSAFPGPSLFPWAKLARYLGSSARHMDPWSTMESLPPGNLELRRQIARRYLRLGMSIGVEQIVVTSGALEALNLSLQSVTRPGDVVAIESPAFYGCLQAVERLGLEVVEIPVCPRTGLDLDALAQAIDRHPIRALWSMPTLHNPTGATLAVERKRELAALLAGRGIPLIEDDAYAELQFSSQAPPVKAFDESGLVLHCGSFSKCLAPGYRLGWVAAGRFAHEVARRKTESSIATSLPTQLAIAQMMKRGGYDAHLAKLRQCLAAQQAAALRALRRHLPADFRFSRPHGGYFLWIECPPRVDALEVHRRALEHGITLAPGPMFSARREYGHYLRLNTGHPWTAAAERAVMELAGLLTSDPAPPSRATTARARAGAAPPPRA
jgi:DNA-binding transcriptional MocR family regulator